MSTSLQYAMKLDWTKSLDVMTQNIANHAIEEVERRVAAIVRHFAPLIREWMRQNAPWNDITGNARRGLLSEIEAFVGESYAIMLDHTEPYGYWLELKNQGRYAILQPALEYFAPQIFAAVRIALSGK